MKITILKEMFHSTLMPSSSLTLRIILTHISVILGNVGCSMQISLSIFMTLFLTLIPVSCKEKKHHALENRSTMGINLCII